MSKNSEPLVGWTWDKYDRYEQYQGTVRSSDFTDYTRYIEGMMLTIVDASFSDPKQREAVKSLVKRSLWVEAAEMAYKFMYQRSKGEEFPIG